LTISARDRFTFNIISCYTNISKNDFISAIKFVLFSTYFIFNNVIYGQTYGTSMGSPLSPIIVDIVMQDLEIECMNKIGD